MKKIIINIGCAVTLLTGLGACTDKLEELYVDPGTTSVPAIDKFFTRMLNNGRVRPDYWEIRTFALPHTVKYTQTASYVNGTKMYQQQLSYLQNRWDDYYTPGTNGGGIMAQYREIEKNYAGLSDADKKNFEVMVQAAKVVFLDQTSQMVDLWGDIPFSEAGSINATGQVVRPKFDDAKAIYEIVLTGLKEASDYFATAQLESLAKATFQKQDILLGGDVDKWRRYTNSLRLRLLMRTSFVDETRAKAEVAAILADPVKYPLVDDAKYDVLLKPLDSNTGSLESSLNDLSGYAAPATLLEGVLKPANDLRIPVLYDKGVRREQGKSIRNEDYFGMPVNLPSAEQEANISQGKYAVLDSATFIRNSKLPGIVFTSSEVSFLKAEAFERWGGGDASTAYQNGVRQSVNFYYNLNSTSNAGRNAEKAPADTTIAKFLANPAMEYTGGQEEKLAKIWTQKWVHLGLLQSVQNWAEVRRTKTPALPFQEDSSTPAEKLPPSRLLYPATEKSLNTQNYNQVAAKDLPTVKIFWDVK
ncbi:SusD/RagB family nutrient-binding outer membrane lipoprotein [Adhaeribacter swui]|uniref:SusD/RagB family nutrient-binding outer membrane lipoprotein n=1 Tax=Adhaeribacter swui TaxID=2086471 RepID=A0A7G7GBH7_9BACT|nr:SusD/RagB family nutrient-binding outer membrane lipoprotein [Adhaeribacter swui]QNF34511.1 SusD/RagB family nutrient-binding outer membrane lipoprotein [Adhaeribacter swui]